MNQKSKKYIKKCCGFVWFFMCGCKCVNVCVLMWYSCVLICVCMRLGQFANATCCISGCEFEGVS